MSSVIVAVAPDPSRGAVVQPLGSDGMPTAEPRHVTDLAAEVRARPEVRWVWPSTETVYPAILDAAVRVPRCHDLEMTEALLVGAEGEWGAPRSFAAAWARLTGGPVPPDPPVRQAAPPGEAQGTLFGEPSAAAEATIEQVTRVYADQLKRISATADPARFRMLVAAESASALVAVEMGRAGLPWDAATHDELLTELLGARRPAGGPPQKLVELTEQICHLLASPGLHPDSPAELRRALRKAGIDVPNTRAWVLKQVEHPAIEPILHYKELYRIWTAHGWSWRQQWVRDGRFHPAYVPGGVVSGRWATRGGGALQIPAVLRAAVRADPGRRLVVADAGQLEPRILAAVSRDPGLCKAAGPGDIYTGLEGFADRATAKVALLGAMYGQTGGQAAPALAVLKGRYPHAWAVVEEAARTGETGGLVRSWLGRTCPRPGAAPDNDGEWFNSRDGDLRTSAGQRARGRFTRNFVIQATAAEWAATLLALVRTRLWDVDAELVFFQHDEVILDCSLETAEYVAGLLQECANEAGRLLFGPTEVHFVMDAKAVTAYADAKPS
ncbi:MAG: bifunctional 3'-5' exonuclease/DNA polymerase [Hamadaea sp.]|uniref:bifunctional 3'-5' exonuclease/DNA polymerase n=1 Tax=Hamadaea sp. TaxID=2024425 RepID=UPI0017A1BA34|nr:bifunctional 3'-5' exonuclease/DNA polymerase [Hamadaea sp.]NUR74230.1 bifunctional 3'-5' exonuclease/DNA polymerase [Hamadaea sp.]NUT22260.1 bifunctional 3'-5' exonuclease/DNA polymerase [Hamadaea sp.]